MEQKFVKNSFFQLLLGLMIFGNISVYAADKEAVRSAGNPLATFEIFLQEQKDEMQAEARQRNNQGGIKVQLNEMDKLIEFVNRVQAEETGAVQSGQLNSKIRDYMTARLFVMDESVRTMFINIFEGSLSISFPTELIQILSAIAADQALSEGHMNYLKENSISFEYERFYVKGDTSYHGIYRKSRIGTSGYGESFRRTSIGALGAIGKHQELPFETLLILAEGMTDPLENGYVTDASYEALKTIDSDYSLFFSPEIIGKFEDLFTADINYWTDSDEIVSTTFKVNFMQAQWRLQANAADLFAAIAQNKKLPYLLLFRMANTLSYQWDEDKVKKIAALDYEMSMSFINDSHSSLVRQRVLELWNRKRNEAPENSREHFNELKVSVVSSFGKIGKHQALPGEVIEAMERLSSSETEHPDVKEAIKEALTSISKTKKSLAENPAAGVCESSMRNPEKGS